MKWETLRSSSSLIACFSFLGVLSVPAEQAQDGVKEQSEAAITREARIISFSGYDWWVKSSKKRVGPGSNYFSDQEENVWLDSQSRLHLRITQRDGRWHCAEIVSQESFGWGTYRFYLATPVGKIDPNVTLGLFTWSDAREYAHREIDVECARWGNADDTNNVQFVVQPYQPAGHLVRFRVPPAMETTTHIFNWQSNRVDFRSLAGHVREPSAVNPPIQEWAFAKRGVPQPGDEKARINLWLSTVSPRNSNDTEVIVAKFEFEQADGSSQEPNIFIASLPPASLQPGPDGTGRISGNVRGRNLVDCMVVVYAYGDKWYAQPLAAAPNTKIEGGKWSTMTHGGTEYAALLVRSSYQARPTLVDLPEVGGEVLAVAKAKPKN